MLTDGLKAQLKLDLMLHMTVINKIKEVEVKNLYQTICLPTANKPWRKRPINKSCLGYLWEKTKILAFLREDKLISHVSKMFATSELTLICSCLKNSKDTSSRETLVFAKLSRLFSPFAISINFFSTSKRA